MLFVRRTRHTLRSAEFGFFGVVVYTRRHTPRFCGQERSAGDAVRVLMTSLPRRISCCTVGIEKKPFYGRVNEGPVLGEREGSRGAYHVKRCAPLGNRGRSAVSERAASYTGSMVRPSSDLGLRSPKHRPAQRQRVSY